MKLLKRILFISALSISGIAAAEHTHYIGADVHWRASTIRGLDKALHARNAHGAGMITGVRFDNFWGFEAGFHGTRGKKNGSATRIRGIHLNLVGVVPVVKDDILNIVGSAGLAHLKHKTNRPGYILDISRVVPRLTAGFELKLLSSLKFRTSFVYESSMSLKRKAHIPRGSFGISTGLVYGL